MDSLRPKVTTPRTVSEGTLKTDDLLEALGDELYARAIELLTHGGSPEELKQAGDHCSLVGEARAWVGFLRDDSISPNVSDIERADELRDDIYDALDFYCAEHIYFGAHEGDGALIGYWPIAEELIEVPAFLRKQAE